MEVKTTLVLGASEKPERYSNKAVKMLLEYDVPVVAVGNREGEIQSVTISTEWPVNKDIHTLSLYLSQKNQAHYYDKIIAMHPQRVIFNPGTENPEFAAKLNKQGIQTEEACTLVLLRTNSF